MEIHHDIHVRNFVHCGGCSYNPNFENCNRAIMAQYVMAPIKTGSDSAKRLPDLESAVSKCVETRTRMSDPFWLLTSVVSISSPSPTRVLDPVSMGKYGFERLS